VGGALVLGFLVIASAAPLLGRALLRLLRRWISPPSATTTSALSTSTARSCPRKRQSTSSANTTRTAPSRPSSSTSIRPAAPPRPHRRFTTRSCKIRDEKKKPIIASIESVGASGAYYIASGANKIYANDASVVGSIGVIMEWTNFGDLMTWAKLKPEVIHAGSLKDAGDPTHAMTPEERAYFQGLVDNMYGQFVTDVANGRHLPADQVRSLATGQVWTGEQALPLHLIDKEGGFRDALLDTAKSVGISGEPSVVKPELRHRTIWDLISNADDLIHQPSKLVERHAGFYFLWR
jgi:signal peptide peptidase SppA